MPNQNPIERLKERINSIRSRGQSDFRAEAISAIVRPENVAFISRVLTDKTYCDSIPDLLDELNNRLSWSGPDSICWGAVQVVHDAATSILHEDRAISQIILVMSK